MTDAELRGRLLTFFYERRHNADGWVPTTDLIVSGADQVSRQAIAGVCQQLADAELIYWEPLTGAKEGFTIGMAKITGLGMDVVTGGRVSSIDIRFPNAGRPDLPAAMPAVKEPERINLADGLKLLEEHLPAEEAKARLRQAFVQKAFSQAPLLALPYDEAIIDWTTGLVKIPRKNDRFCPTFLRADFASYFLEGPMNEEISEAGRKARFELWEKLGLDRVKADLAHGGIQIVGGPPQVQDLAWEWVRMKEAALRSAGVQLRRDPELIQKLLLKLENYPSRPGDVFILSGKEPELAIDGYSVEQIAYHLQQLREMSLIDSPGSQPMIGVTFRGLSSYGHDRVQSASASEPSVPPKATRSRKVFIVHGHDAAPRAEVARFIEKLGFQAIILHERPNKGRTLIMKFREEADGVGFAVVLMTPDDLGKSTTAADLNPRARQNVVFELGFFIGKLGPERVAALVKGNVEKPSDFDGVVYISLDSADWQRQLGRELQEAGYDINWNMVMRP